MGKLKLAVIKATYHVYYTDLNYQLLLCRIYNLTLIIIRICNPLCSYYSHYHITTTSNKSPPQQNYCIPD